MSSLNLSTNGPSITKSYQSVLNAPLATSAAAASPTYGQWAVFSVAAPLANAFQQDSSKESVMKVQSTGEGELVDFIDEFSDGRIQFAFLKVKDPNTTLPKNVFVCWCGEGVPERTKGYFTSHQNAVAKLFQGYHVQITARSDRDLTPDGIIQKVADSSGSRYSGASSQPAPSAPKPSVSTKPVFTPTKVAGSGGFNPAGSRVRVLPQTSGNVDADGWGEDAPPVTRTQLEKVAPAYQPTKVKLAEFGGSNQSESIGPEAVKGAYQPVGKVDIAEIRRQARESGQAQDNRPTVVKGAYEPVGKVDIAAIRARAQQPSTSRSTEPEPENDDEETPKSLADRSAAFAQPERLTSLPKPKVASKFAGASNFSGTTAPIPGGFTAKSNPTAAPVGIASRTFADQGGKTPAQIWAEKKAAQGGSSSSITSSAPIQSQTSGSGGWKSGYSGKTWAPVQTTRTGQSAGSDRNDPAHDEPEAEQEAPKASVGSIREKFAAAPPPVNLANRPVPPPIHDEEEEEEEAVRSTSPIRVAMPVRRAAEPEPEPEPEPPTQSHHRPAAEEPKPSAGVKGKKALVQYDYEKAEDNEIELKEGEWVTNIEQVDPDWWMGQNAAGETGLFPANYVDTPIDDDGEEEHSHAPVHQHTAQASTAPVEKKPTATAQYDYEAAEDNELSFPEGGTITNLEFPDDDWWFGEFNGKTGLFPANYVQLNE